MEDLFNRLRSQATVPSPKDRETGLPKRYIANLSSQEKSKQVKAIEKSMKEYEKTGKVYTRPRIGGESKRSPFVKRFEELYGFPITDIKKVKQKFPSTDVETILSKGRAAYASGSRPNQTPSSWAFARLASVLTGGKALAVDKDEVGKSDLKKILESK